MVMIRKFLGTERVLTAAAERQPLMLRDQRSNQTEGVLVYNQGPSAVLVYYREDAPMAFWEVQPGESTILPVGRSVDLWCTIAAGQVLAHDVSVAVVA